MRPHTIIVLALVPIFVGCSPPTAKSTLEDMKKAACARDVPGFFSHVDKTKITEVGVRRAKESMEDKGLAGEIVKGMADDLIQSAAQKIFIDWEDDIKKGTGGDLCKMEFMSADEHEHSAEVKWKTPSGKDKVWRFQKFDKTWLAVELAGVEPPVDVAKECADLLGVLKAGFDTISAVKDDPASATPFGELEKATGKVAESLQELPLRDAGLKQRRRDYVDTLKGIVKATNAMNGARAKGEEEGAKIITSEGAETQKLLKLRREQLAQLKEHCAKP